MTPPSPCTRLREARSDWLAVGFRAGRDSGATEGGDKFRSDAPIRTTGNGQRITGWFGRVAGRAKARSQVPGPGLPSLLGGRAVGRVGERIPNPETRIAGRFGWGTGWAGARGFTLAELVMVCALVAILAAVAIPTSRFTVKREREAELRLSLRLMRNAIDDYKRLSDQGMIAVTLGTEGYPEELELLVEGVEIVGQENKRKFLRRIPIDPMTGEAEWGLRSYQDEPDSFSWGGENVYDVYSLSEATALDGTKYKDW